MINRKFIIKHFSTLLEKVKDETGKEFEVAVSEPKPLVEDIVSYTRRIIEGQFYDTIQKPENFNKQLTVKVEVTIECESQGSEATYLVSPDLNSSPTFRGPFKSEVDYFVSHDLRQATEE